MVRPGDALVGAHAGPDDVGFGSYGLDQCLDLVEAALGRGAGLAVPEGAGWLVGEGMAPKHDRDGARRSGISRR